ncbi:MAG: toxin-antitoxin system HicB family antitoxin [Lutispora sp.]|nr:toxin-antitoxin system HicB family antitoxin [Lutispora sp.]MEA4964042.1 toxin-antitoxin system HicB family antitoxin [Lutispora sp.]
MILHDTINSHLSEMDKKNIDYYMSLPYNHLIQPVTDESGSYYYGRVLELDGCQSTGETFEEAYSSLREAMRSWLEVKIEYGDPIPDPAGDEDYSGKFILRIPKSLHKRLAIEAQQEGVSLNQYAMYKLSK